MYNNDALEAISKNQVLGNIAVVLRTGALDELNVRLDSFETNEVIEALQLLNNYPAEFTCNVVWAGFQEMPGVPDNNGNSITNGVDIRLSSDGLISPEGSKKPGLLRKINAGFGDGDHIAIVISYQPVPEPNYYGLVFFQISEGEGKKKVIASFDEVSYQQAQAQAQAGA